MPTISVVVPVYNVEKYVEKCLDSICAQTFTDIEIIVVDDGSTDKSGIICDEYSKKDSRIRVYHKENGGLSSARNYGIDHASGDYIGFVDSDDYIDAAMYQTLYNNLIEYDADMSLCGLYDMFNGRPRKVNTENKTFTATNVETIQIVLEAEITSVTAVNKLYKKALFQAIRYPEGKVSEDAFIIVDLLLQCKKTAITTTQLYYYIHRSGSITTLRFRPENFHVVEAYMKNYALIKDNCPELLRVAKMRLCWAHMNVLDKLIFDNSANYKDKQKKTINYIRKNYFFIMRNKSFTAFRKVAVTGLMLNKNVYKECVVLQNKRYQIE